METELEIKEELQAPPGEGESPAEAGIEAGVTATPPEGKEEDAFEDFEPEKKGRVEKRIHGLLKRAKMAEEEATALKENLTVISQERDSWRGETLKLSGMGQKPQEIQVDISDLPVPRRDDYDDEDEYLDARSQRAATIAFRKEQARERQQNEYRQAQEITNQQVQWQTAGRAKYADFDIALSPTVAITPIMGQAIMGNEQGHDVAYFLGKNPQESYRIASLHPIEQTLEIQKLAMKMAKPKPKTETTAPSPNLPVGEREVVQGKQKPDHELSFKEYEVKRNRQLYGENWGRK